ncbi:MAG TPA: hypothetical protein DDX71_04735 [Ruminococcus sp.]|nr:hypothetical protein [Ruminococcus sp.]
MRTAYIVSQVLICTALMSALSLAYLEIAKRLRGMQSARSRYAAWWLLGVGFLLPFKPHLPQAPVELRRVSYYTYYYTPVGTITAPATPRQMTLLLMFWVGGMLVTAVLMLHRQMRFSHSVKRLRTPAGAVTQTMLDLLCIEMETDRKVPVYVLPVISTPMLGGLLHPAIYLPAQKYDNDELRLILKHELTHLMHGDLWCKLLWMGARTVHWFNPLMPMLMRRMEQDCEFACDESVMRGESHETAAVYCSSILNTAMHHCAGRVQAPILATNFSGSRDMLKARMNAIFSRGGKRNFWLLTAAVGIVTLLTGSFFVMDQRRHSAYVYAEDSEPAVTAMPATTSVPVMTTMTMSEETTAMMEISMPAHTTETVPAVTTAPMPVTENVPAMTTVFVGADGVVYAVTAYGSYTETQPAGTSLYSFNP